MQREGERQREGKKERGRETERGRERQRERGSAKAGVGKEREGRREGSREERGERDRQTERQSEERARESETCVTAPNDDSRSTSTAAYAAQRGCLSRASSVDLTVLRTLAASHLRRRRLLAKAFEQVFVSTGSIAPISCAGLAFSV